MRILPFIVSTILTVLLIILLNNKWGAIPPLGKFLSPQQGFWQNAEPGDYNFSEDVIHQKLKGTTSVYFDERLVPHVFAENDEDVYFVQGYLHAKFRLWQMEFQTHAAAGRISEILGSDQRFLHFDREQRRLGMTYGAENALKMMEANDSTKKVADAYTAGINAFISSLNESTLPIEYKLLDYKPEKWSNYKIALFLKQMSKTLAGHEQDFENNNIKTVFSNKELNILFPQVSDSTIPIVPKGTVFAKQSIVPLPPATADSLYFGKDTTIKETEKHKPGKNIGSNNWVISGSKTKSGYPILCNDPHLDLTFPSIWYEMQLSTPTMNAYGASFPGSPSVIIGYNDSLAFGFTNSSRDVKDYYKIKFKDASKKEYRFNGEWKSAQLRIEEIKIKGAPTYYDTVAYTIFGPVMYDDHFSADSTKRNDALAVKWMAHEPSNELLMWIKLNRATDYATFKNAIQYLWCPGQNIAYASKRGTIAMWHQGKFPALWKGQGQYPMPGEDSSYNWQGYIPQNENPYIVNAPAGYIQSANQRPADSTYPYFIPGNYFVPRGIAISKILDTMVDITPKNMMALQNSTFSITAKNAVPLFLKHIQTKNLTKVESSYLNEIKLWDYMADADSRATTIFRTWFDSLETIVWKDEFSRAGIKVMPEEQTLLEALLRDSTFKYIDNINTPEKEDIKQQITAAFKLAVSHFKAIEKSENLLWWKYKNTSIYHLLRTAVLPFAKTGIYIGGWSNTINAVSETKGPSWRMIVHLTPETEAYGVYPGGQSGNPGSRFYDKFVDTWINGEYYKLWMMKKSETQSSRIKWKMTFSNASNS